MVEELKQTYPTANKVHTCMYCGGKINVGEKYERSTCKYDDTIYDWKNHIVCQKVARELGMMDDSDDDGLTSEHFCDDIDEYVYEHHYDNNIDDIAEDWQGDTPELVIKIAKELKII